MHITLPKRAAPREEAASAGAGPQREVPENKALTRVAAAHVIHNQR